MWLVLRRINERDLEGEAECGPKLDRGVAVGNIKDVARDGF